MSILALDKVSYQYEGGKKNVLKSITMQFEHGKLYVIMGKSGAGKSTLLSLISGLDLSTSGDVLLNEKCLRQFTYRCNRIRKYYSFHEY